MIRGAIAATVAIVVAGAAQASEAPLYKPTPDWVKPAPPFTPAQLAPSAPLTVLYDMQQRLQDGEVWSYFDSATRMANADVVTRNGTLTLPWQPDHGDLVIHRVEIVRGGERIDLLAGGKRFNVLRREQQLEQLEVNGVLSATMAIEGLRIGDVLHVAFSTTNRDTALGGRMQALMPLPTAPARFGFLRARMIWPVAEPVQWKIYADGAKPVVTTANGYREVLIESPLPKLPDMPQDMPVRFAKPTLLEATSFADWPAVSRTMAPLYDTKGLIAPGSPLAAEVARIKAAESDPRKRAALALDLVQDKVRYLFNGMNGGNYLPQPPAETWSLRYGDCKAKTLLLLALLRGLDIEAEAVVAPAQAGDVIDGRLPIPGAFDHVIVRATIGGESVWLDGTMSGTRLADLDDVPTFRTVLPLRPAGAGLMPVPFRAPARPVGEVVMDVDQRAGVTMPVLMKTTLRMRGPQAAMVGLVATQAAPEQQRDMVQQVMNELMSGARLTEQSVAYDAATGIATISASGLASSGWQWDRGRHRIALDGGMSELNFQPDRARPAWRSIPVQIGEPRRTRYHETLRLPQNGRGYTLAGDQTLAETMAARTINRRVALDGGTVTLDDEVVTVAPDVPADAVAATRARVALVKARKLEVVGPAVRQSHVADVAEARRNGTLQPLLAAYAKAIANDPEDRENYLNRARFLAGIYDYKGAIPDVTRAIEIEPTVDDYVWRASLYEIAGDAKRQRADLDEAIALDPGAAAAAIGLASYQAKHGERDAGLALMQERIDAGGKEVLTYQMAKADMLADLGERDGALAVLDELVVANPTDAQLLNARCWMKATLSVQLDTALKDCNRSIELTDTGVQALDSRAMVHYRLGQMDAALADLGAALETAPDLPASLYLRGIVLQKQGKSAEATAALATARTIAPLIDAQYARWGIKP
ncbi:hypothetical protein GCM10011380_27630 [Sphingomonas metalli]|uniref:DUF3857 domain-containing protein n=1 Tax=Sphingomonas metalli TaxID=1779358 RepID=A0A916WV92_9SPHN|nr:DUF3857 domain-containing protein [Sphingomonas metalli]GGB36716.1 hypothetical protein GCM10011380_27630 [Sphingomonas metalli]